MKQISTTEVIQRVLKLFEQIKKCDSTHEDEKKIFTIVSKAAFHSKRQKC